VSKAKEKKKIPGIDRQFVVGKNGLFEKYQDTLFKSLIKSTGNPSSPDLKEVAEYIGPKIPVDIMKTALAFLEWCYEKHKSEGCLLFRNLGEKWEIVCPPQYVGGAHVCYHPVPEESCGIMGDIHSHPKFGTGHSGTDHVDECKFGGIAVVVNDFRIPICNPTIFGATRKVRFKFEPETILESFGDKDFVDTDDGYTFPEEWKEKVIPGVCQECKTTVQVRGRVAGREWDHSDGYRYKGYYGGDYYGGAGGYYGVWQTTPVYFKDQHAQVARALKDILEGYTPSNAVDDLIQVIVEYVAGKDISFRKQEDFDDLLDTLASMREVQCPSCRRDIEHVTCSCGGEIGVDEILSSAIDETMHGDVTSDDKDENPNEDLFGEMDMGEWMDDPIATKPKIFVSRYFKSATVTGSLRCTPDCPLFSVGTHAHALTDPSIHAFVEVDKHVAEKFLDGIIDIGDIEAAEKQMLDRPDSSPKYLAAHDNFVFVVGESHCSDDCPLKDATNHIHTPKVPTSESTRRISVETAMTFCGIEAELPLEEEARYFVSTTAQYAYVSGMGATCSDTCPLADYKTKHSHLGSPPTFDGLLEVTQETAFDVLKGQLGMDKVKAMAERAQKKTKRIKKKNRKSFVKA